MWLASTSATGRTRITSGSTARLREVAAESGRAVGLLADLQGPKIRLGTIAVGPVTLVPGSASSSPLTECPGDARRCTTTYEGLPGDVSEGDTILIDDGRVSLRVERVEGNDVVTEIVEGGQVSNHRGSTCPVSR